MAQTRRDFLKQLAMIVPSAWLADKLPSGIIETEPVIDPTPRIAADVPPVIMPTNISDPIGIYLGNGEVLIRGVFAGDNGFEGQTLPIDALELPEGVSAGMLLAVDDDGHVIGYGGGE